MAHITRILSKAEGVPPLWTWPKMVVRVSKPSFCDTSWTERWWSYEESFIYDKPKFALLHWCSAITDLLHIVTCDCITMAIYCSLCNNDNVQTGATASLLEKTEKPFKTDKQTFSFSNESLKIIHDKTITSISLLHRCSSHPSSGGISGMKTQSAPQAKAVTKAR